MISSNTMPIDTISNWYRYSQIEYFTPFMKLWLAFNSWYKQFLPNCQTDRNAINEIKDGGSIRNSFDQIFDAQSDDGEEFREALALLVKELRIQKVNNVGFTNSDIEPNFQSFAPRGQTQKLNTGNIVKLDRETAVISDKSILFSELVETIYQIRCGLIHGEFDVNDRRAHRLVKGAFICLNKIFGPIVLVNNP